jgi:hypothetical protein
MSVAIRPARKRSTVEQADGAAPQGEAAASTATRGKPSPTSAVDTNRVGIVLVHGIGQQPPCDTFLDWSGPIADVLRAWRHEHGYIPTDPVRRCTFSLTGTSQPILELDIPKHDGHAAQTWVVTEAWWASLTRAPSLDYMTRYVRRALGPIMRGIRESYTKRTADWAARMNLTQAAVQGLDAESVDVVRRETAPRLRWAWIDWLDRFQKELTVLAFGPALVLGTVVLTVYAPFRKIPIKAISDMAILRSADTFLTRWFGELPDIIDDPIQAANVRSCLVHAIEDLRDEGCGRVVVIAHSGGAIVSFTTLLDPAYLPRRVDKLITLGEGLALAWRIEGAWQELDPGSRLAGDLSTARPDLRWIDFWSSYDPAPAGRLDPPPGVRLADDSRATVNRMSILEDHGSYWDNDEGFVIPLIRELDTPTGSASESRFYRNPDLDTVRLERRRQRVGILALWRWVATLGAVIPLGFTSVMRLVGGPSRPGPERLGLDAATLVNSFPGHQLVTDPLDALARAVAWSPSLSGFYDWCLGVGIATVMFLILARIGVGRWSAWDLSERREARLRVLHPVSRVGPILTLLALSALTVALSVGTVVWVWR